MQLKGDKLYVLLPGKIYLNADLTISRRRLHSHNCFKNTKHSLFPFISISLPIFSIVVLYSHTRTRLHTHADIHTMKERNSRRRGGELEVVEKRQKILIFVASIKLYFYRHLFSWANDSPQSMIYKRRCQHWMDDVIWYIPIIIGTTVNTFINDCWHLRMLTGTTVGSH